MHQTPKGQLVIRPESVTEAHMIDVPPTQLAHAPATALDLLECEATQLVPFAALSASPKKPHRLPLHGTDAVDPAPSDNAAVVLMPQVKEASLSDTPMLLPAPQLQHQPHAQHAVNLEAADAFAAASSAASQLAANHKVAGTASADPIAASPAADEAKAPVDSPRPDPGTDSKQHKLAQNKVNIPSINQLVAASTAAATTPATAAGTAVTGKQQPSERPSAKVSTSIPVVLDKAAQPQNALKALQQHSPTVHGNQTTGVAQAGAIAPVTTSGSPVGDKASQHIRPPAAVDAAEMAMQGTDTGSQVCASCLLHASLVRLLGWSAMPRYVWCISHAQWA